MNKQEYKYIHQLLEWWGEHTKPKVSDDGAVVTRARGRPVLEIKDLSLDGKSRLFFDGIFEVG